MQPTLLPATVADLAFESGFVEDMSVLTSCSVPLSTESANEASDSDKTCDPGNIDDLASVLHSLGAASDSDNICDPDTKEVLEYFSVSPSE